MRVQQGRCRLWHRQGGVQAEVEGRARSLYHSASRMLEEPLRMAVCRVLLLGAYPACSPDCKLNVSRMLRKIASDFANAQAPNNIYVSVAHHVEYLGVCTRGMQ